MKLGNFEVKSLSRVQFFSGYEETKEKILDHFISENVKKNYTGTINLREDDFFGLNGTFKLFFSRNKLNSIPFYAKEGNGKDNFFYLRKTISDVSGPILKEGAEYHYSYYFPDAILILGLDADGDILNVVLKGKKDSV